jgi:hypothetical protein
VRKVCTLSLKIIGTVSLGGTGEGLWSSFDRTSLGWFICFGGGIVFLEIVSSGMGVIVCSGVMIVLSSSEIVFEGKECDGSLKVAHPANKRQNIKKLKIFFTLTKAQFYFIKYKGFNTLKDFF